MINLVEPYLLGERLFIHDSDGHRVFLDPMELHMTVHMIETHIWEPHVRQIIARSMKSGGCYVDVGANVGFHALYAAGFAGEAGKVICAEPNNRVFHILKDNMDINGFMGRSRLYRTAVSNYTGTGTLKLYEGHAGGSGLGITSEFGDLYTEEAVPVDTLDSIVTRSDWPLDQVDVLKIDVEGFELMVLLGGTGVLESPDLTVILEWQPGSLAGKTGGNAPRELLKLFADRGFQVYQAGFMQPLQKRDLAKPEELLSVCADLVFTRRNHLDDLIGKSMEDSSAFSHFKTRSAAGPDESLIRDLEFSKKAFYDAVRAQDQLKEELVFSKKAFEDAVAVQEQLKDRIYHPTLTDWLRCCKYLIWKHKSH